jgi:hypothetical protein
MKHNEITVTRPRQQEALDIVTRHLDAFVAGLTDSQVFGYLLDMSQEQQTGYTVRGAVIYEDSQSETTVYSE